MNLYDIVIDLQRYKNTDRDKLMISYVVQRLDKSLQVYIKELNDSYDGLYYHHDTYKLMKKLNR